jgi:hypothetical protein
MLTILNGKVAPGFKFLLVLMRSSSRAVILWQWLDQ